MRRELIKALDYPKSLVLEIIGEGDCPHDSLFEITDKRCQQCDVSRECHWVRCLNDFAEFDGKSTHTINASLRYGINLVETLNGSSPTTRLYVTVWPAAGSEARNALAMNSTRDSLRIATDRCFRRKSDSFLCDRSYSIILRSAIISV